MNQYLYITGCIYTAECKQEKSNFSFNIYIECLICQMLKKHMKTMKKTQNKTGLTTGSTYPLKDGEGAIYIENGYNERTKIILSIKQKILF